MSPRSLFSWLYQADFLKMGTIRGSIDEYLLFIPIVVPICCCLALGCVWLCCDPMDCSLPGSSVYGISQARILGWVAISFSEGLSRARDWAHISFTGRWGATRKAHIYMWEVLVGECIKNSHKNKKWPKQFLETHCLMGFNRWKKNSSISV